MKISYIAAVLLCLLTGVVGATENQTEVLTEGFAVAPADESLFAVDTSLHDGPIIEEPGDRLHDISPAHFTIQIRRGFFTRKPYLVLVGDNGETVMHGERLENFGDALHTAIRLAQAEYDVEDLFHA